MPITIAGHRTPEELARLGVDLLQRIVEPNVGPEDAGKFVAIDVDSGQYEIDADDYTAVSRLLARLPSAEGWLGRIGQSTTCRIGRLP